MKLPRITFQCNACRCTLSDWYSCTGCSDLDDTFDLCSSCWQQLKDRHVGGDEGEHRWTEHVRNSPESDQWTLRSCDSFARTCLNRFRVWSNHWLLGTLRTPVDIPVIAGSADTWEQLKSRRQLHRSLYHYRTYDDVYRMSRSCATWLLSKTPTASVVAIVAANSAHWIAADFAVTFAGLVSVPINPVVSPDVIRHILDHSKCDLVFCDALQYERLISMALPSAVSIVMMDGDGDGHGDDDQHELWNLAESEWLPISYAASGDEIRTIMYTSGSTGQPKGALITDDYMNREIADTTLIYTRPVDFLYDPLAYSSGRLGFYYLFGYGGRVVLFSSHMESFFREVKLAMPTQFSAVPRIWNMLYAQYQAKRDLLISRHPNVQPGEIETMLMREFSDSFGPRCVHVSTGGAPPCPQVLQWMRAVFKDISCEDGYGTSEGGAVAVNGKRVAGTQCHLEDVPELGYFSHSSPSRGLLWIRTDRMASGYHNAQQQTEENFCDLFQDGNVWFRTGDIVEWDRDTDAIAVIDRKKNIFKLAQGVFVAPEYLENVYTSSPWINAIYIWGLGDKDFPVAVVCPNQLMIEQRRCDLTECKSLILHSMRELAKVNSLQGYQLPANIYLEMTPWTVQNGLLTQSLKPARLSLRRHYKAVIEQLYGDGCQSTRAKLPDEVKPSRGEQFIAIVESAVGRLMDANATLPSQGLDSVGLIHVFSVLRASEFDVSLEDLMLRKILQISERLDVNSPINTGDKADEIDWESEIRLVPLTFGVSGHRRRKGPPKVLLTGANGFLGVHIVMELLLLNHHPELKVMCMVRAASDQLALDRFLRSVELYRLNLSMDRVQVVAGDIAVEFFGWTEAEYHQRCLSITQVIHNGCWVNGVLPYRVLRSANVGGTIRCIQLAAAARASLVYVSSTTAVSQPLSNHHGYGSSKRVSELLTLAASEQQVKVSIVRPGTIGGSSISGVTNDDFINRLLRAIIMMKYAPISNEYITLVPVDEVATAVVNAPLCNDVQCIYGTVGLRFSEIVRVLNEEFACDIKEIPYANWRFLLMTWEGENPLTPLLSYFEQGGMPAMSEGSTLEAISPSISVAQPFDRQLLALYVKNFTSRSIRVKKNKE